MANKIFDLTNFVIDRPIRGLMLSSTDMSVMWSINQITNPTLSITTEKTDAVDALGAKIMTFERAKNAEFSAENSLFDLGLYAAQAGTEKEVASSSAKMTVPAFEEVDVNGATVTLKHAPVGQIMYIYELKGDSTLGTKYVNGSSASTTEFVHTSGSTEITVPEDLETGSQLFVQYEYETEKAVAVHNQGTEFPKAGIFYLEVLGADICDPTNLIHAYVKFPNAKLVSDVDLTFSTESTHSFTIQAMPDYCDKNKRLLSIIVPDED